MLASLRNMFKVPDLRNKILFTLLLLALYRFGCHVPTPGVDFSAVQDLEKQAQAGGVLGFLSFFSGGALTRFAVFGLGIMPYITSSIIMQVLTVVIPKLEQWQDQGAVGQKKITQWTRYLTVVLAIIQSTGLAFLFHNGGGGLLGNLNVDLVPHFTVPRVMLIVLSLTAGTAMVMWMGELITQRGIGNGMSLLIFSSVVSDTASGGAQLRAEGGNIKFGILLFLALAILVSIVAVEQGQRRIPVNFAKRIVGRRMYGGQSTYIPLKVNQAGVIPVIFASSLLYLPAMASQFNQSSEWTVWIERYFVRGDHPLYMITFFAMIVFFTYFYVSITFNPEEVADNMKKYGGFIPGIRAGKPTEDYLSYVLSRITLPGSLYLGLIALIPLIAFVLIGADQNFPFGGTSILIMVGVALDTVKQIESQLQQRNYEGFLR